MAAAAMAGWAVAAMAGGMGEGETAVATDPTASTTHAMAMFGLLLPSCGEQQLEEKQHKHDIRHTIKSSGGSSSGGNCGSGGAGALLAPTVVNELAAVLNGIPGVRPGR